MIEPLYYEKMSLDKLSNVNRTINGAVIYLKVTNHGLSDQIVDDYPLRFENSSFTVDPYQNGRKNLFVKKNDN